MRVLLCLASVALLAGCPGEKPPVTTKTPPPKKADPYPERAPGPGEIGDDGEPVLQDPPPVQKSPKGGEELQPVDEKWDGNKLLQDQGDPTPPPPPPEPPPDPATIKPVVEGDITKLPGIRIWRGQNRMEVDGAICLKQGPTLELLGCTRSGKTHESLILFGCAPFHLNLALILLGLEPTPQVNDFGQPIALEKGAKVVMEIEWKAEDGPQGDPSAPAVKDGKVRRWVEDLIYDRRRKGAMPRVGWVFTGSRMVKVPAPPDWKTEQDVFAAEYTGNVAAVYHDPDAILDTPLIEGGDDTLFYPYSERLPDRGTSIVIHLRPWTEEDQKAYGENAKQKQEEGQGQGEEGEEKKEKQEEERR